MWGRFFPIILQWRVTNSHIKDALRAPSITHLLRCSTWILKGNKKCQLTIFSIGLHICSRKQSCFIIVAASIYSAKSCTCEVLHQRNSPQVLSTICCIATSKREIEDMKENLQRVDIFFSFDFHFISYRNVSSLWVVNIFSSLAYLGQDKNCHKFVSENLWRSTSYSFSEYIVQDHDRKTPAYRHDHTLD